MKSDKQLKQDVIEELDWEPSIDAVNIGVEVKDGIVTLAGHLNSYVEKWNAERAVQRVAGVKGLAIELDVKLPGSSQRNDADIAHSVRNILEWHSSLPYEKIHLLVENGWVTLSGEVDWIYQKKAAEESIRFIKGVKGIKNLLTSKPTTVPKDIKSKIEAALQRRAAQDAKAITIDVNGNAITLSGTVHSFSERCAILAAVRGAKGVTQVNDHLMSIV